MNSVVPALLLLVAAAPSPAAEAPAAGLKATATSQQSQNPALPDLVFEETEHDFGSVFSEEWYTLRFRFRSPAGLAVTVTKVAAPCKCTAAVVRMPDTGAGQEWGEIEVKVNFGDADGAVSKQVQVYLATGRPAGAKKGLGPASADATQLAQKRGATDGVSAGKQPVATGKTPQERAVEDEGGAAAKRKERESHVETLTLKAFVIKRGIRLKPARLVFGRVKRDARLVRKVRAEIVTRFAPTSVTKVCCSAPWIQATVKEVPVEKDERWAIAQVSAYELEVTLDAAKAPRGRSVLEFVTLYTTAARWPFVDLPIKARLEK